jgi:hypothetical protein
MDPFSIIASIQSTYGVIFTTIGNVFNQVFEMISSSFFLQIIMIVIIIGKCIFLALRFAIEVFLFFFMGFIPWFFSPWPADVFSPKKGDEFQTAGFVPYVLRYIIVIAMGIMRIPKCILWYALDTAAWIMYLPFRFAFWSLDYFLNIGMTDKEHKVWNFLDEIDYFIHGPVGNWFIYHYKDQSVDGPDPDSLNLGFHIIHFPNSVMETCFSISPYSLATIKGADKVSDAFNDFISCATNPF